MLCCVLGYVMLHYIISFDILHIDIFAGAACRHGAAARCRGAPVPLLLSSYFIQTLGIEDSKS